MMQGYLPDAIQYPLATTICGYLPGAIGHYHVATTAFGYDTGAGLHACMHAT